MSVRPRQSGGFPLLHDSHSELPRDGLCPTCGKTLAAETVTLIGGALYPDERGGFGPAKVMRGFLDLYWSRDLETREKGFLAAKLEVASDVEAGQFSVRVCSLQCLATFFSSIVSALAVEVERELKEYADSVE